jgi:hypothetical protein
MNKLKWADAMFAAAHGQYGPRWIRAAAILQEGTLWEGARHCDIIASIVAAGTVRRVKGEQGFVTNKGEFLDRKAAAQLALSNGQLTDKEFNRARLFSEELWSP